ncbi:MAG TPA: YdeI/OmpD-associated family protein [Gaiellales bacterium]|nr:YdeI/OmpD-associated family protein [Gaiellales bacterium]
MTTHRFEAVLGADAGDLPAVVLPADVAAAMGGRARIPVAGTINGVAFRGSTMPMGDGRHCVGFRKGIRSQAGGVEIGDSVVIEIGRDDAPRTVAVPPDLAAALAAEPGIRAAFDAMSYTHRREWVEAVEAAKRPETRARRIAQAVDAARARIA